VEGLRRGERVEKGEEREGKGKDPLVLAYTPLI